MTTLNLQVGVLSELGSDDCTRRLETSWFTLTYNEGICADVNATFYDYSTGLRFTGATIGQGDTIDAATMQFRATDTPSNIPTTYIEGEDADNPGTFTDTADYDGRARTSAVSWTPGAWVDNTWYTTSELKTLLQVIVDRGSFAGDAVVFFWRDAAGWGGTDTSIKIDVYEQDTTWAAKLDIDYTAAPAGVTVTVPVATLTTSLFAPVIKLVVIPPKLTLSLATFTPVLGLSVIPPPLSLSLSAFAPTVTTTANVVITPPVLALSLTAFVPTVSVSDNQLVTPPTRALSLTAFAPTVTATGDVTVTVPVVALSLTAFVPTIGISDNQLVIPGVVALTLSAFAPTVSTPVVVTPGVLGLNLAAFAPTVTVTGNVVVTPGVVALSLSLFAPTVLIPTIVTPGVVALSLALFAPTISVSAAFTAVWLNTGSVAILLVLDGSISLPAAINDGTISIKQTEDATI